MEIKTIITGVTGMVGEGVLHECLMHPDVESFLVINRKSCGVKHEKLKEVIHKDFLIYLQSRTSMSDTMLVTFVREFLRWGKKKKNTNASLMI